MLLQRWRRSAIDYEQVSGKITVETIAHIIVVDYNAFNTFVEINAYV